MSTSAPVDLYVSDIWETTLWCDALIDTIEPCNEYYEILEAQKLVRHTVMLNREKDTLIIEFDLVDDEEDDEDGIISCANYSFYGDGEVVESTSFVRSPDVGENERRWCVFCSEYLSIVEQHFKK